MAASEWSTVSPVVAAEGEVVMRDDDRTYSNCYRREGGLSGVWRGER
jgi:hypothetical protein